MARIHRQSRVLLAVTIGLLAGTNAAQLLAQDPAPILANRPAHGIPGTKPGTERWIVQFATRTFDLSAFRTAILTRRPANAVAVIVKDLERLVQTDQQQFVKDVTALGGTVITQWWLVNAAEIEIDPAQLLAVRRLANVALVQPDEMREPVIAASTNGNNHRADALQSQGFNGAGVTVGVIDTGQDENVSGQNRPHRMYFIDGDPNNTTGTGIGGSRLVINRQLGTLPADDVHGHGTGVASICAGANWGTSAADDGHSPLSGIAGYAVSNNSGGGSSLAVLASAWQSMAVDRAVFNTVATNMSYSASPDPLDVSSQAIDSAAYNADVMCIVAGGNTGSSTAISPSAANGLAVAAVSLKAHTMASFSSIGPLSGDPQRFYPDISACGLSITMARRDNETGNYVESGTSMAAPQVAGAAAQLRARFPALTALDTKAVLLVSAAPIDTQNPGRDRNSFGMGLLRNDRAHSLVAAGKVATGSVSSSVPQQTFTIPVVTGQSYRVAITWYRQDMSSTSWSNLDLEALDPNGLVIATSATPRNLYEVLSVYSPFTGNLTVRATGTTISNPSEPFSIAWTDAAPVPVAGIATTFGVGCAPVGLEINTNGTPAAFASVPAEFAYGMFTPNPITMAGFEVYSQSMSASTSVLAAVYGNSGGAISTSIIGVRQISIGTQPGFYRVSFSTPLTIPAGPFWISLDHRLQTTAISNMTSGSISQCYQRPSVLTGAWTPSPLTVRPAIRVFEQTPASGGQLSATIAGSPTIGQTSTFNLANGPHNGLSIIGIGISNVTSIYGPLPRSFASVGGIGCSLLMSADLLTLALTDSVGASSMAIIVPNTPSLVSTRIYGQGIAWAPAANGLGLTFSNGVNLFIGN
ncbi:MAG: subtilisin family serine protease [Planctomycetota bacterium]|jgi:subtilisin family serine protease